MLAEIQERNKAVKDLEQSLLELHQIFLDMAVLVEAQVRERETHWWWGGDGQEKLKIQPKMEDPLGQHWGLCRLRFAEGDPDDRQCVQSGSTPGPLFYTFLPGGNAG